MSAARPTRSSISPTRVARAPARSEPGSKIRSGSAMRLAHRHARIQARERILKHDLQVAASGAQRRRLARQQDRRRATAPIPCSRESSRRMARASVDLPDPDSPTKPERLAGTEIETHIADGGAARRIPRRRSVDAEQ